MHVSALLKMTRLLHLATGMNRDGEAGGSGVGWCVAFRKHEYLVQGAILSTSSHKSAYFPPTPGEIFHRP